MSCIEACPRSHLAPGPEFAHPWLMHTHSLISHCKKAVLIWMCNCIMILFVGCFSDDAMTSFLMNYTNWSWYYWSYSLIKMAFGATLSICATMHQIAKMLHCSAVFYLNFLAIALMLGKKKRSNWNNWKLLQRYMNRLYIQFGDKIEQNRLYCESCICRFSYLQIRSVRPSAHALYAHSQRVLWTQLRPWMPIRGLCHAETEP